MLLWVRAYYHWNRNEAKMSIYLLPPKIHLLTKPESRRILNSVANSQSKVEMFVLCLPSSSHTTHPLSAQALFLLHAPAVLWRVRMLQTCEVQYITNVPVFLSSHQPFCGATRDSIYRRNWSPERLRDFPKVTMSLKPKEQEAMTGKGGSWSSWGRNAGWI